MAVCLYEERTPRKAEERRTRAIFARVKRQGVIAVRRSPKYAERVFWSVKAIQGAAYIYGNVSRAVPRTRGCIEIFKRRSRNTGNRQRFEHNRAGAGCRHNIRYRCWHGNEIFCEAEGYSSLRQESPRASGARS